MARPLREPLVHFFVIGALLFFVESRRRTEARVVEVSSALKQDLKRRFEDTQGRKPSPSELSAEVEQWKKEEAIYREALREGAAERDPTVRGVLVESQRAQAELRVRLPPPSSIQLQRWLEEHADKYRRPLKHRFEFIECLTEDKTAPKSPDLLPCKLLLEELGQGVSSRELGVAVSASHLSEEQLKSRLPAPLANKIITTHSSHWQSVRADDIGKGWLVHLQERTGGLPPLSEVRSQVEDDFRIEEKNKATWQILQQTVDLYEFRDVP